MTTTKKPFKNKKQSVRLASHITPTRYTLTLKPDLEAFVFEGNEVIDIVLNKAVKEITLHSKDLSIATAKVTVGKTEFFAEKISYDIKAETATFHFKKPVAKGKAKLSIVFAGLIADNLRGFYKSTYEIEGVKKHIATTQFEATDARRAFPCFDEPAQKAVFDVSLIIANHHTAISNTLPTVIAEHEAGYKIVTFASTPKMSTYLLAFIIGEFEYIEKYTKDNVQVRVFTTAGKKHQAQFALDVAIKSLEFYNEYFDISYPLPVLDLIAIPDFESAAMENWGAVTFRETAILVDEEHTSLATKQWVAIVVAHEIAHQWFGNLVTMEWWTDLWLNEGFASYMENLCADAMFPQWHVWDLYLADRYTAALRLDSLANSHPIEVPVHHPDEINEIFDMVSYAKGSAVIRQLASYLGADTFRNGLRHYIKKHSYKNTHTVDLWESFEKVSKKPVKDIMKVWTGKTGYPLVSVSKKGTTFIGTQERFFLSRISKKENTEKTIWQIPFHYQSHNEVLPMLATKKSFPFIGTTIGKVNINEGSFIRTRYDKETLSLLQKEIERGALSVADRLGIIRDMFALAEGGYITTSEALAFALSYKNEQEYIVWSEIASGVDRIYNLIKGQPCEIQYAQYAALLFATIAQKMGWTKKKGEAHADTFLRNLALSHAALYGDTKVIKEAQRLFKERATRPIPADIRGVVYGIIARNGSEKEWKLFEKLHNQESLHEEKDRYARALAQFKDEALLSKTLAFALSDKIRLQDAPFVIAMVWQNTHGRDMTWKFVQQNWKELSKRYGEGGHFLGRLLSPLGNHTKIQDLKKAKKFFATHTAPGAERSLEQSYERIASNAAWLTDDKKDLARWLKKNYKI